jgi:hypothetical protein
MMWRMSGRVHGSGMCLLSRDAIAARMEIASLLQPSNFAVAAKGKQIQLVMFKKHHVFESFQEFRRRPFLPVCLAGIV